MKKGTALNGAQTLHWFCMVSLYLAWGSLWCVRHVACIEPMTPWILVVALTTMQWLRGDHDRLWSSLLSWLLLGLFFFSLGALPPTDALCFHRASSWFNQATMYSLRGGHSRQRSPCLHLSPFFFSSGRPLPSIPRTSSLVLAPSGMNLFRGGHCRQWRWLSPLRRLLSSFFPYIWATDSNGGALRGASGTVLTYVMGWDWRRWRLGPVQQN